MGTQGQRPVAYCASLGLLDLPCTLAHVVDVTPRELDLLARKNIVVAHNPSSNMKLASGAAPVAAMLERKMSVGLGTDGAASNNRLNMFTEMGRAALLHKLTGHDPTLLPAAQVLDMGTLGAPQPCTTRAWAPLPPAWPRTAWPWTWTPPTCNPSITPSHNWSTPPPAWKPA